MTTDLLETDAGVPDPWEAGTDEDDEVYRCGCPDCRALRGGGARTKDGARDA